MRRGRKKGREEEIEKERAFASARSGLTPVRGSGYKRMLMRWPGAVEKTLFARAIDRPVMKYDARRADTRLASSVKHDEHSKIALGEKNFSHIYRRK